MVDNLITIKVPKELGSKKDAKFFVDGVKDMLITTARSARREEEARGFDKEARKRVDGIWDRPITSVSPFGKISYHARVVPNEAILGIYEKIIKDSPTRSGRYARYNLVYVNSKLVARRFGELKFWLDRNEIRPGQTIRFINAVPYARRLERHAVRKGSTKIKVDTRSSRRNKRTILKPNGVYALAGRFSRNRFGALGYVKFGWFSNGSAGITLPKVGGLRTTYASSYKTNGRVTQAGRPYVYPVIVVKPFTEGISPGGPVQ